MLYSLEAGLFEVCVVVAVSLNNPDGFAQVRDLLALFDPGKVDGLNGDVLNIHF